MVDDDDDDGSLSLFIRIPSYSHIPSHQSAPMLYDFTFVTWSQESCITSGRDGLCFLLEAPFATTLTAPEGLRWSSCPRRRVLGWEKGPCWWCWGMTRNIPSERLFGCIVATPELLLSFLGNLVLKPLAENIALLGSLTLWEPCASAQTSCLEAMSWNLAFRFEINFNKHSKQMIDRLKNQEITMSVFQQFISVILTRKTWHNRHNPNKGE